MITQGGIETIKIWLILASLLVGFFALFNILGLSEKNMIIRNIQMKIGIIATAWVINFIVFTSVLWIGEYAVMHGVEWVKNPCQVTLISTGVAKVVLSILLLIGLFAKVPND